MTENKEPLPERPLAAALAADPKGEQLPKLVAAGRGAMARQILELAFAHGVKVREDAALAEILVALDLDSDIPSEAIVAVGEILSKIYEANTAMAAGTVAQ